jgi:hypothetical protein
MSSMAGEGIFKLYSAVPVFRCGTTVILKLRLSLLNTGQQCLHRNLAKSLEFIVHGSILDGLFIVGLQIALTSVNKICNGRRSWPLRHNQEIKVE